MDVFLGFDLSEKCNFSLYFLLLSICLIHRSHGGFIEAPADVYGEKGSTVSLSWLYKVETKTHIFFVEVHVNTNGTKLLKYRFHPASNKFYTFGPSGYFTKVNVSSTASDQGKEVKVKMVLKNVSLNDAGVFTCLILKNDGGEDRDDVKLIVTVPTTLSTSSRPVPTSLSTSSRPVPTTLSTSSRPMPTSQSTSSRPVPTSPNTSSRPVPTTLSTSSRPGEPTSSAASGGGNVVTIIFVVIATVLVIVVIVMACMLLKQRRRNGIRPPASKSLSLVNRMARNPRISNRSEENDVIEMVDACDIQPGSHDGIYETPLGEYEIVPDECENPESENDPNGEKWELEREKIKIEKVIGKGSFGQVAKGLLRLETNEVSEEQIVAIKMVKEKYADSDKNDLLSELHIMKSLGKHPNVIHLLGCVTKTEPLLVVIAFVPFGDLLGYLRKSRGQHDNYFNDPDIKPKTNLSSRELIRFARDVACGMEFLAMNKVVHRDLAARNVLVGEELVCKITDFGMARDVYRDNVYTKTSKGRIPVKWTAYESLMYNKYTTQSDVWSYGVLLFEIFTIGGTPYPGIKSRDVYSLIKNGYRMEKPAHLNENLHSVMLNCWKPEPEERPSFSCLKDTMADIELGHKDYVNLGEYDSSLYENSENFE